MLAIRTGRICISVAWRVQKGIEILITSRGFFIRRSVSKTESQTGFGEIRKEPFFVVSIIPWDIPQSQQRWCAGERLGVSYDWKVIEAFDMLKTCFAVCSQGYDPSAFQNKYKRCMYA